MLICDKFDTGPDILETLISKMISGNLPHWDKEFQEKSLKISVSYSSIKPFLHLYL